MPPYAAFLISIGKNINKNLNTMLLPCSSMKKEYEDVVRRTARAVKTLSDRFSAIKDDSPTNGDHLQRE